MKTRKLFVINFIGLAAFIAVFQLIQWILGNYHLAFMNVVIYPYLAIVVIFSLILVIGAIHMLFCLANEEPQKMWLRILSKLGAVILSLLLVPAFLYGSMFFAFWHQPEHVVEKDGKKMVAYVDSFLQITVTYYDYKNPLVRGSQMKIMVDGGNGGSDPFENGGEGPYVHRYIYYDDNGNVIDSNWAG